MSASTFEIKEEYTDHLPARKDESGADYYRRLHDLQAAGTWLKAAVQAKGPKGEIDAILETIAWLTAP